MRLLIFVSIFLFGFILAFGCSSSPISVTSTDVDDHGRAPLQDSHSIWGEWTINLNPESETVSIFETRESQARFNVTSFLTPPNCADCLQVAIIGWDPAKKLVTVKLKLKNPTALTGYDVKAIISNYDMKEFIAPDAYK